ncbi:unnamed protein product, partial [Discosporangium mesarthrocarpum]
IADFGLSARFQLNAMEQEENDCPYGSKSGFSHRRQSTVCGTPYYTAPEVFGSGSSGYDGRGADVWSAGIVLYAMLAGKLPFEGADTGATLDLIEGKEVTYPSHFSGSAKDLLRGLLQKTPETRTSLFNIMTHPWMQPVVP